MALRTTVITTEHHHQLSKFVNGFLDENKASLKLKPNCIFWIPPWAELKHIYNAAQFTMQLLDCIFINHQSTHFTIQTGFIWGHLLGGTLLHALMNGRTPININLIIEMALLLSLSRTVFLLNLFSMSCINDNLFCHFKWIIIT